MSLGEGVRQNMEGVGKMQEDWQSLLAVTEGWAINWTWLKVEPGSWMIL